MTFELRSDWHPTTGQLWLIVCAETHVPRHVFTGANALERAKVALADLRAKQAAAPPKPFYRTAEARARLLAELRRGDDQTGVSERQNAAAREAYRRRHGRQVA